MNLKKFVINKKKAFLSFFIVLEILLVGGQYNLVNGADLFPDLDDDDYSDADEPVPGVADYNLDGPGLKITFDNSDGDGEITATALPGNFEDENSELYFTWYLKKNDCDLNKNPSAKNKEKCDKDNDGEITENDWKIEAARIIALNKYDGQGNGNTNNDGNKDGYEVEVDWSGDNDDPECYVQDFDDGRTYELKETKDVFSCSNPVCVSTRNLTCQEEDLPDNPGIFVDVSKQACQRSSVSPNCDVLNAENFTTEAECTSGTLLCLSGSYANDLTSDQLCSEIGNDSLGESCASLSSTVPTCTFEEKSDGNICKHLFAQPDEGIGEESGDGEFNEREESFWGTDPKNVSTAGNSSLDEANIVGLGIDKFTWTYESGDKIGLVVEGESVMKTKHNDGKNMIMWAFSNNKCSAISDAAKERRFYIDNYFGFKTGILTIGNLDLNDCLEENLLDPYSATEGNYLNVNLSVSPSSPVNDSVGSGEYNRGSVVKINSVVDNVDNASALSYQWSVELSSDGTINPSLWKNITNNLTEHGVVSGLGNSDFNFKLNLPNEVFLNENIEQYLKVKVMVSENGSGNKKSGKGEIIFKLNRLGLEIVPYGVIASDADSKLSLNSKICDNENIGTPCSVSKNEVVGVKIPNDEKNLTNFSWKINGEELVCNKSISNDCQDGKAVNLAFFPILGEEGDEIEITASAIEGNSGQIKNFSKKFIIIKPYVKIVSTDLDQVWPVNLGYYKNLDGTFTPDVSEELFRVVENLEIKLKAAFSPEFIASSSGTEIFWTINRESKSGTTDVSFKASEKPGSTYNVNVKATYVQPVPIRKALERIWNVSQSQTAEEIMEHSIQVEVIDSEYDEVALKGTKKFLANIASNVPEQVTFLLKIILAVGILIGFSGLAFSLGNGLKKEN